MFHPGDIQGQVKQGSEQPGLVENVPAKCREGIRLDRLSRSLPTQTILSLYEKHQGPEAELLHQVDLKNKF